MRGEDDLVGTYICFYNNTESSTLSVSQCSLSFQSLSSECPIPTGFFLPIQTKLK